MTSTMPSAAYGVVPAPHVVHSPRCWQCGNRLAEYLAEPYSLRCRRCKAQNRGGATLVSVTT